MAYSRYCIVTALGWTLLPGCPLKVEGDETGAVETASESDSDGGASSASQPSGTGASAVDVTEASGAGDSETDTSDSETDTSDSTASGTGFLTTQSTSDTDTDGGGMTDGDPDTDGEPLPAFCGEPEAEVAAAFDFAEGWFDHFDDLVTPCTVDDVSIEAGMIVTAMTCVTEDGPQASLLRMAEAVEGPPAWSIGDAVLLRTSLLSDIGFDEVWRHFDLRLAADDSLLAVGVDRDTMHNDWLAPITFERSYPCGPADDFNGFERKYQLDLELMGQTLSLTGGQRGTLAIDASQLFAVDVQRADTNLCCHFEGGHWQHLLIRRVMTP